MVSVNIGVVLNVPAAAGESALNACLLDHYLSPVDVPITKVCVCIRVCVCKRCNCVYL
jgi:hypothetical protein